MKGMRLPRNMRIKKNEDGTISLYTIRAKLTIPLRRFEKMTTLTPSAVSYLRDYESSLQKDKEGKVKDIKTLERIRTILSKVTLKTDPILDYNRTVETRYTEAHYRRLGYKGSEDYKIKVEEERLRQEAENKEKREAQEKKNADAQKK